jgi:glycosyltransferase involved in cell wall biosynthesis
LTVHFILDPDFARSGHHLDYFHIVCDFAESRSDVKFTFVVPAEAGPWVHELTTPPNLTIRAVEPTGPSGARHSRAATFRSAVSMAEASGASGLSVVPGDGLQLSLRSAKASFPIHVLLMSPEVLGGGLRRRIANVRKLLQNRFALLNPNVRLLVLNNSSLATKWARLFRVDETRVRSVRDPTPLAEFAATTAGSDSDSASVRVLSLGTHTERKNVVRCIDAVHLAAQLSPERSFTLAIVGRFPDPSYLERVERQLAALPEQGNLRVELMPEFVSDERRNAVVADATVLFAAYDDFAGSSGVVALSGSSQTPVVVARGGVMEQVVSEFMLGPVVDPDSVVALASGILFASRYEIPADCAARFRAECHPRRFVAELIGSTANQSWRPQSPSDGVARPSTNGKV